jgi:hypothetical protein
MEAAGATPAIASSGDDAAAALGGSLGLFSPVELSISAEGIADTDTLSAPDPLAVIYERTPGGLVEIGRTEVIGTRLPLVMALISAVLPPCVPRASCTADCACPPAARGRFIFW